MKNIMFISFFVLSIATLGHSQATASAKSSNTIVPSKVEKKSLNGKEVNYIAIENIKLGTNKLIINGNQFQITKSAKGEIKIVLNNGNVVTEPTAMSKIATDFEPGKTYTCHGDAECNTLLDIICNGFICDNCVCTGSGDDASCTCTAEKRKTPNNNKNSGGITTPTQTKKK
jgi:hypothetical protein